MDYPETRMPDPNVKMILTKREDLEVVRDRIELSTFRFSGQPR
jgi:hypothetical protein